MRGLSGSGQTANFGVYLDGIPIQAIYQQSAYNHINLNGISEINVSKGYTSPIYGMKSLGGAINMVTAKPKDELELRAKYGFVANNEHQAQVAIGSNLGKYYFSLDYGYITRDSLPLPRKFKPNSAQTTREMRNAYYDDHTLRAKVGYEPNENHEYSINLTYQRGKRGGILGTTSTSTAWNWPQYNNTLVYMLGRSNLLDNLTLHSRLYYHSNYNELISPNWGHSVYDDYRTGGIFHIDYAINEDMNLQVGVNIKDEVHRAYSNSSDRTGSVPISQLPQIMDYNELHSSLFAQYGYRVLSNVRFLLSGSYDRADMLHVKTSPNGTLQKIDRGKGIQGWSLQGIVYYDANDYTTIHANIGKKTNMPSAWSRYSSSRGNYIVSNPNLGPESAINYEVGASFNYEGTKLSGTAFIQHLNDMIIDTQVSSTLCSSPITNDSGTSYCTRQVNADEGFNYGLELSFNQALFDNRLSFGANYTYTNSKVTSHGSSTNNGANSRILNYPTQLANANITYKPIKQVDIIAYYTYQGKRYILDGTNYSTMPNIALLDVKINYRPIDALQLSLGASNVLDKLYYYSTSAYMAGRRIYASIEYKF